MTLSMIAWFAAFASAVAPSAVPDHGPTPADQVHVVGIELDGDGQGGTVWTEAERLSGSDRGFVFGRGDCAKFRVADRVLAALFDAMRTGSRVQVRAVQQPGGAHCLKGVRFIAP